MSQQKEESSSKARPTNLWFPFLLIAICAMIEYYASRQLPVQGNFKSPSMPNTGMFNAMNARENLIELTSFGPRVTGSKVNEISIPSYLVRKLGELRKDLPNGARLEIERQNPASNFYLDFLGGITNVYQNVTNIAVRLSWPEEGSATSDFSVLLNAHFDSIPGSPGAADDGVGVACMMEALRVLAHGARLHHSVIMLFNGAEESNHQAAHGFITQHPWAPSVKYVFNLEAIGTGGQEMMFQCNSGWLAAFYGRKAPHPHASVIAHELFKYFIHRMASTDWSTLIGYGSPGIRGLDTAYIENGYVYHTSFDTQESVPDGTLVNTGENILYITKALADAVEVPNFTESDSVDQLSVFFDFLGLHLVVYGGQSVTILHSLILLAGIITAVLLGRSINNLSTSKLHRIFCSEVYCFALPLFVAAALGLVMYVIAPMRWYDGGIAIAMLTYGPPTLLSILYVRGQATEGALNTPEIRIMSGLLFPWILFLAIGVVFHIMSVYTCCLWIISVMFSSAAHAAMKHYLLRNSKPPSSYLYSAECVYLLSMLPMMLQWVQIGRTFFTLVVPLLGKSGTTVPTDPAVGALVALLLTSPAPLILGHELTRPVLSKKSLRRAMGVIGVLLLFITLLQRPYSNKHPKRLWIQHVHRKFMQHHEDKSTTTSTTCGMWVLGFDEQGMTPLQHIGIARLDGRHKAASECSVWDGDCYMKFPYYFSVSEVMRDSHFIPSECPEGIAPAEQLKLSLSSIAVPNDMSLQAQGGDLRLVKVSLNGPSHMHLILRDNALGKRILRWYIPNHRVGEQAVTIAPLPTETASSENSVMKLTVTYSRATGALVGVGTSLTTEDTTNIEEKGAKDEKLSEEVTADTARATITEEVLYLVATPTARAEGIHYLSVGFGLCSTVTGCHQNFYLLVQGEDPVQIAAYGHYTDQKEDTEEISALMLDLPNWSKGAEWTKFPSYLVQDSV